MSEDHDRQGNESPPSGSTAPARRQRIAFSIHSELPMLLLPADVTGQLESKPILSPIPNVKPWLRGILNLRGTFVPVFDLALSCGREALAGNPSVLVLSPGPRAVGVLCTRTPDLVRPGPAEPAAASDPLATLGASQYPTEAGMVHEFDLSAWLSDVGHRVIGATEQAA